MDWIIQQARRLEGEVTLPADKSIAHRAALFAGLAEGTSELVNYPSSADPQSTISCLKQLGVEIKDTGDSIRVRGKGLDGLREAAGVLDCGNSGTTIRLLAGILAGQSFKSILSGDYSLKRRPMARIAAPLKLMGAKLELVDNHPPVTIIPSKHLDGITYRLSVPSAQVKSCVLLAGLYARGDTTIIEPVPTRDHTERMLGLTTLEIDGIRHISIEGGNKISPRIWIIPKDFSAAAFFIVAGLIAQEGELNLPGVGLNPSRIALLDVLKAMGADILISNERTYGGEPIGDITVKPSSLTGVKVSGSLIPNLIDEIPVLAVAGAFASGQTIIRDAKELRVKESDRIRSMVDNIRALDGKIEEFDDGFAVTGGHGLKGGTVDSFVDHRIAMSMGVAGLSATGSTTIKGAESASVSFPGFWEELERVRG